MSLSKRTLEIALAAVERDIEGAIAAGPCWRELIPEVTAAAELEEAIPADKGEAGA